MEYADPNYNGVDIKRWRVGKNFSGDPDLVIECTNYSKTSYLGYKRALSYILHLKQFPNSEKVIVVSYWDNIKALASPARAIKVDRSTTKLKCIIAGKFDRSLLKIRRLHRRGQNQ